MLNYKVFLYTTANYSDFYDRNRLKLAKYLLVRLKKYKLIEIKKKHSVLNFSTCYMSISKHESNLHKLQISSKYAIQAIQNFSISKSEIKP